MKERKGDRSLKIDIRCLTRTQTPSLVPAPL